MVGFLKAGGARKDCFNFEVLANFKDEHKKVIGDEIDKQGYPDCGSGRYSKKMSYQEWFDFNKAQT